MTGQMPVPMKLNCSVRPETGCPFVYHLRNAARRHHHAERGDEGRDLGSGDQLAVDEPGKQARCSRPTPIGMMTGRSVKRRIKRARPGRGLGEAGREHRRHADDGAGGQIDAAGDDHLRDADGDDADDGNLQDHDRQALRVHQEALADEDPAEDFIDQRDADQHAGRC